jgi:hypothetical protein
MPAVQNAKILFPQRIESKLVQILHRRDLGGPIFEPRQKTIASKYKPVGRLVTGIRRDDGRDESGRLAHE